MMMILHIFCYRNSRYIDFWQKNIFEHYGLRPASFAGNRARHARARDLTLMHNKKLHSICWERCPWSLNVQFGETNSNTYRYLRTYISNVCFLPYMSSSVFTADSSIQFTILLSVVQFHFLKIKKIANFIIPIWITGKGCHRHWICDGSWESIRWNFIERGSQGKTKYVQMIHPKI